MPRKVHFSLRGSTKMPDYGTIYCEIRPTPYKKIWFPLGIVITKDEWERYVSVNYFYHTKMQTLDIHYHKFADFMDKVMETVKASKMKDAQRNVQKLMLRMCTKKL